jgi:broad specificity phosphatase PhoE
MYSMSYKIILIRHGESLANVNANYYFWPDQAIILTEKGAQQAMELSKKINSLLDISGTTKIISSRLTRAMLTADIACHHTGLEIHRDHRLNECQQIFRKGDPFESNESVRMRVKAVLDDHQDTSLILFCHGELMWHLDPGKPQVENTEYRIYNRDKFYEEHILRNNRLVLV